MATPEHYAHVLLEYSDRELRAVVRIATGRSFDLYIENNAVLTHYKEIQVASPPAPRPVFRRGAD